MIVEMNDRTPTGYRFHHVGVGTMEFDVGINAYRTMGLSLLTRVNDPGLRVQVAFLSAGSAASPLVEILAPLGEDGPLASLIRRRMLPTPYHVAFSVPDLSERTGQLVAQGYLSLGDPKPARAMCGAQIQFLFHRGIGLVELIEENDEGRVALAGVEPTS